MYQSDIILNGQTYPGGGTDPGIRCYDTTCVGTNTLKIKVGSDIFTCTDATPGAQLFTAGATYTSGTSIFCPNANEIYEICNTI